MSSLLATKLHRLSVPAKRVQRPHLIQHLNEGLESGRQITLVSAPAGFGKTTCISEWVNGLDLPITWLWLDESDNDPVRFFAYFITALQKVDENIGRDIEGVLRSGQLPPSDVISTTLINDILELGSQFLLVLDDFHVIQDHNILEVLEKLVTNLLQANVPQPLHLVLLTREDPALPLAKLRATNRMTEIRAGDLRFTNPEAGRFLNEVMGLALSPADIAMLEDRTEGWIVGLQLAGLSVRDRANPSGFIATLSGSHRYILSYLTEQVLRQLPEEIQAFLLQTSILDKLSGDLCNAVTGRTDGQLLLERLFSANLFLIPLDDEQQWYRYHHLFADLLRNLQNTLHKDQTAELHRHASRWYAQSDMPNEAIQHALAAADYAQAMQLLENHATGMLMQGYMKTVEGWLSAIPPQLRSQNPRTNLAFAWMHLIHGTFAQASPYLERLQAIFSSFQWGPQDDSLKAEWLTLQSYLLAMQGKPSESVELANQALAIVPEANSYVRSLAANALGSAYLQMNDYTHAVEVYQKAIQYGRTAESLFSNVLGPSILAQIALQRGQLHMTFKVASQGIDRLESSGALPPVSGVVYGALAQVCYQWHQMEPARRHALRAIQLCSLGGYRDGEAYPRVLLARLLQWEGNLEVSSRELQKALDLMQSGASDWVREEAVSQQVRFHLAQNRLDAAEASLQEHGFSSQGRFSIPDLTPGQNITHLDRLLYNAALRILLYRARAQHELEGLPPGIELADRLVSGALQAEYLPVALEVLLIRAQMHAELGNSQASLADCVKALELAEPEGYILSFLEEGPAVMPLLNTVANQTAAPDRLKKYARKLLDAFPGEGKPVAPHAKRPDKVDGLIEPLTARELQVLRLVAAGDSNQTIATKLVITVRAVKKHTGSIFGKLNVSSRTQAIARARQLGLLSTEE